MQPLNDLVLFDLIYNAIYDQGLCIQHPNSTPSTCVPCIHTQDPSALLPSQISLRTSHKVECAGHRCSHILGVKGKLRRIHRPKLPACLGARGKDSKLAFLQGCFLSSIWPCEGQVLKDSQSWLRQAVMEAQELVPSLTFGLVDFSGGSCSLDLDPAFPVGAWLPPVSAVCLGWKHKTAQWRTMGMALIHQGEAVRSNIWGRHTQFSLYLAALMWG